jgi:tetratricopeptide (TPR) repeat protein
MEQTLLTVDSLILDINLDNIKYKIDVMYNISLSLFSQDKISQAEEVIYRALHYAKEYSVFHNFGELNMLLSLCYKSHKKYIDAINSINKSIEYFSLIGDEAYIHRCYINLGILLRYEAKYEKALYYLNKSMNYFRNSQYTLKYNNCLAEIIKTTFLLNKERIDMEQLRHVIDLNQDDKKNFSELLIILGIIYLRRGNIDKALEVLKESECYFEPSVDAEFKPYLYYSLSIAFSMLGQIDDAIKYLLKHSENINLFTEPIKYFVNNIQ